MTVDIHALSGAYAVDAVDEFERAHFERHLADCASCRAEVESLREAGALIAETSAQDPPPALRASVLAEIRSVRPLPPVVVAVAERGRSTRRRFPALVAAAAALIVVGGTGGVVWNAVHDDSSQGPTLSVSEQVLQAPDAERVPIRGLGNGATATVVRSKSLNRAVIVTEDMPEAPRLRTYELWFQHDDDMIPAGQMAGGSNTVILEGDAATADGVGITIELAGEPPTTPSDDQVALVGFDT